jgi:tRNA1(Val) A37 N6-methylase TrmN6
VEQDFSTHTLSRDGFLNKTIWLLQPKSGYRAGIDPVFLAASLPLKPHQTILDCGCGVGAVSCFLLARMPSLRITGVDINERVLALAQENHTRNGFEHAFRGIHADLTTLDVAESFDHVLSNPPFYTEKSYQRGPSDLKSQAHQETLALKSWVAQMLRPLKHKGYFSLILPTNRLGDFFDTEGASLGDLKIFPLWPSKGVAAKRVILQGQKGTKGPPQLLPGLVLHGENAAYTQEADAVLRGGVLDLTAKMGPLTKVNP